MARWVAIAVAAACFGVVGSCSGDDNGGAINTPTPNATDASDDGTTTTLDKSPFCVAIRGLEALGNAPSSRERTQALVLEQTEELLRLVEEATNNAPQDAPADVSALLRDYRLIGDAVVAAAGDTDAAMASLASTDPELTARLPHRGAFAFFADLCGTAPPT